MVQCVSHVLFFVINSGFINIIRLMPTIFYADDLLVLFIDMS